MRGVFVMVPCGVPRAITTWTWVLRWGVVEPKIQPRAQSSAQGLVGHLPKMLKSQNCKVQVRWKQGRRWLTNVILSTRRFREQLLGRASDYSLTGSSLKQNNFNKNYQNTCFPCFCWHLPQGQWIVINLLRLKESWLGRRESTPIRHAWGLGKDVFRPFMELYQ